MYSAQRLDSNRGFSLVELLVVVGIIAVLAVIGITIYSGTLQAGRDSKRQADIQAIAKALESNYDAFSGLYPALSPNWFITPESGANAIPIDPIGGTETSCYGGAVCRYCFKSSPTNCVVGDPTPPAFVGGTSFVVCANLESTKAVSTGLYCLKNQR